MDSMKSRWIYEEDAKSSPINAAIETSKHTVPNNNMSTTRNHDLRCLLRIEISAFVPLAVFIPEEQYASGRIIFHCAHASSKTNNER